MSVLTRDEILNIQDITFKEIEIPSKIPAWGGKKINIRQLSRGLQDEYLKRQFGQIRMRQDNRAKSQELTQTNIYGHDTWICINGIVDGEGKPIFTAADEKNLSTKSGEAIGWIASQIIEFSGMKQDVDEAAALARVEDEIKN